MRLLRSGLGVAALAALTMLGAAAVPGAAAPAAEAGLRAADRLVDFARAHGQAVRFDALGVHTAFTEVDIRMLLPADPVRVAAQAEGFGLLLRACLLVRHCVSYTMWGSGQGSATPFDENLRPKPAYFTIRDTFALAR